MTVTRAPGASYYQNARLQIRAGNITGPNSVPARNPEIFVGRWFFILFFMVSFFFFSLFLLADYRRCSPPDVLYAGNYTHIGCTTRTRRNGVRTITPPSTFFIIFFFPPPRLRTHSLRCLWDFFFFFRLLPPPSFAFPRSWNRIPIVRIARTPAVKREMRCSSHPHINIQVLFPGGGEGRK